MKKLWQAVARHPQIRRETHKIHPFPLNSVLHPKSINLFFYSQLEYRRIQLDQCSRLLKNSTFEQLSHLSQDSHQGSLCYYERKQWIKSMITLIRSAIYTETVIEWCLHNTFFHTYSHSCMNPEVPFVNYSASFVHTVPIYSISHHLCDLRKKPHVILIQLNHYKQRYPNLCCRKQIWLLLASAFQTHDICCHCLINSYVVDFYESQSSFNAFNVFKNTAYLYVLAFSTTEYDLVFRCPTFFSVYSALANRWAALCKTQGQ